MVPTKKVVREYKQSAWRDPSSATAGSPQRRPCAPMPELGATAKGDAG